MTTLTKMDSINIWLSLAVLLLASCVCLADEALAENRIKHHASGLTSLRSRRMVGGTMAPLVPWQAMVSLEELNGSYAGGALIAPNWVLTAGRNLFVKKNRMDTQGTEAAIPKVYLGITGRPQADTSKEVAVEKVFLHPGFQNQSDWDNNLALIQLKTPVVLGPNVYPIPLPELGQHLADSQGEVGVIAGWGWGALFSPAQSLKHLVLPLADDLSCKTNENSGRLLHSRPTVDETMFCTGPSRYQENLCYGDAGGALVVRDHRDVYAAGILSFDKACSTEKYAIYMKLSEYLPWIHSVLRGDTEESATRRAAVVSEMHSWQRS
ncbi:haptoglobin [Osmerus mordax]|uniref:haptoglobin n=1 Tax=Osmerus mordax TaxID=8014 RepID=UPI00350FC511